MATGCGEPAVPGGSASAPVSDQHTADVDYARTMVPGRAANPSLVQLVASASMDTLISLGILAAGWSTYSLAARDHAGPTDGWWGLLLRSRR